MIFVLIPFALVLIVIAFASYFRTVPSLTRKWALTLGSLRSIAFVLIVVLLGDPRCMHKVTVTDKPLVISLIDNSASMSLPVSIGAEAKGTNRFHEALSLEERLADGIRAREGLVRRFFFSSDLSNEESDTLSANWQGTDILKTLNTAYRKFEDENIAAIVLFSDGVETVGKIKRPGLPPIPVFAVGIGDTSAPEDVRIEEVDYSSIVKIPARTTIMARLVNAGVKAKRVHLSLSEGANIIFAKNLEIPSESSVEEKIRFDLPSPGKRKLLLQADVEGFDVEKENNRREIIIVGEKGEVKVLIVDMLPRWELHFFLEFLKSEKMYEFDFISRKAIYIGGKSKNAGVFTSILNDYDVLALLSLTPEFIDGKKAAIIRNFIEREGKGLLILPGNSSIFELPETRRSLGNLMPFSNNEGSEFRLKYISLTPGRESLDNPIVADLIPIISQTKWQERAPLLGHYLNLKPRAGARVLLETNRSHTPALVYFEVGMGRVIAMAAGPMWRWKFLPEEGKVYDDLMRRMLDVLARGERGERFSLKAVKNVFEAGEPIGIFAELYDKKMRPITGVPVRLEIYRIEKSGEVPLRETMMQRDAAQSMRFRENLPSLDPGSYRLEAEAELPGGRIKSNSLELKISDISVEYRRVKLDKGKLEIIAARTGGRYIEAKDILSVIDGIRLREKVSSITSEKLLRTDIIMFAAVIILLVTEWIIRKRVGMI